MFIAITTVLLLTIYQSQCLMNATVTLHPPDSPLNIGKLVFTQNSPDSRVQINGSIFGLNASSAHGFHVHTNPVQESSPNCTAAGSHFNPYNTIHGPRSADITLRHVGDLGNVTSDDEGIVVIYMEDSIIQLYNVTQSIINRTVVVHLLRDDGGAGGFDDSNTTGNAGPRIICGLIKLDYMEPPTTTTTISTTTVSNSTTTVTTTPTESNSTITTTPTESNSTTTSIAPTPSISTSTTTKSAGFKIQPIIFAVIIALIINYIL